MSAWGEMGEPVLLIARLAMVVVVLFQLRRAVSRVCARRAAVRSTARVRTGGVDDQTIVSLYNDALLLGWPADERATFDEVALRSGSSNEHVRLVVAAHRVT